MKKLLLSSVIMFGVCSFAHAQNDVNDAKFKKAATPVNSISPAPQKEAVATGTELKTTDADAAATTTSTKAAAATTTVDASGVVVDAQSAKKAEAKKVEAAKAAPVPANKKSRDN